MKSKISLITLGFTDFEKMKTFYETLGFMAHGDANDDFVMFKAKLSLAQLGGR